MSETTISETCGCGATFSVTARYANEAGTRVSEWRREHKHAESVGICGDRLRGFLDREPPLFCNLMAGHIGAHSDGEAHWQQTVPAILPRPNPSAEDDDETGVESLRGIDKATAIAAARAALERADAEEKP